MLTFGLCIFGKLTTHYEFEKYDSMRLINVNMQQNYVEYNII